MVNTESKYIWKKHIVSKDRKIQADVETKISNKLISLDVESFHL